MVEWTALEMRRTLTGTLGSNPSLSAKKATYNRLSFLFITYSVLEVISVEQFAAFRAEDLMLVDYISAVVAAIRLLFLFLQLFCVLIIHVD